MTISSASSTLKQLLLGYFFIFQFFLIKFSLTQEAIASKNSKLFREYIGAESNNVKFSDVPVSPNVDFHYILSFAIDYTTSNSPRPTNGNFNIFWDKQNLSPSQVYATKSSHRNIKVAMSLGGDTVSNGHHAYFSPTSVTSWVKNAINSITKIVKQYHLDGIDIDYEHFNADPNTFAECIGKLVLYLKQHKIVSFVSIAPYEEDSIKSHYLTLWRKYGHLIDYVNFQFYAYDKGTNVQSFLRYFNTQTKNYKGGNLLVSFGTDNSGGLKPENGFFKACSMLKSKGLLHGIFVWSADDSKKNDFHYEKQAQDLLASKKMLH